MFKNLRLSFNQGLMYF